MKRPCRTLQRLNAPSLQRLAAATGLLMTALHVWAQSYTFGTLAGSSGYSDGLAAASRFYQPTGLAVDAATNVYVADFVNHVVRKIMPLGTNWIVSTFAGLAGMPGTNDALGSAARFNQPNSVAVDSAGNVYVADSGNHTIRKISPLGQVSTLAGRPGVPGTNDATGSAARFDAPAGVAVDASGNVYVADLGSNIVRKVSPAGVVITLAGLGGPPGTNNGTGSAARFYAPFAVAVDRSNNVYVADSLNFTIRKITPTAMVSTLAGLAGTSGTNDGPGTAARFSQPEGVALDASNNVYVADWTNHTIRVITPAGMVSTLAGAATQSGNVDGPGTSLARFNYPSGAALDAAGNIYVSDEANNTIRIITPPALVSTFAGRFGQGTNDGLGGAARFFHPHGAAVDSSGKVYVADEENFTIRKIAPNGSVSTLAGLGGFPGTSDGTGSAARFFIPEGVGLDSSNNVYVADQGNHTIRRITPAGVVSTIAGAPGTNGIADGTNSVARFYYPSDVAVDASNNVFVTDAFNHTIRKIRPSGTNWIVTTIAGLASMPGIADGTNSDARFSYPWGLCFNAAGLLYVADFNNSTIRKLTPSGTNWIVTTLAGNTNAPPGSADGTGTNSTFNGPDSVAVDGAGNLFVCDTFNYTVRKITPGAVVSTIGGLALAFGHLDGTTNSARFSHTEGVAVDTAGNLYVADYDNNTIRKGIPATLLSPPLLYGPRFAAGQFSFGISGLTGLRVEVLASSVLAGSNWQVVGSYALSGGTNSFISVGQRQGNQFYRGHVP